ncbi:hypothetical protein TWF694_008646 [Orbilia ellipsospora]|uniref:Uncharacterized protein n=1 Tax=Orbilia ellipsospora TaxID=2528407 RepID=A0AAV9XH81_9PEZI
MSPGSKKGALSSLRASNRSLAASKRDEGNLDAQLKDSIEQPSALLLQGVTTFSTEISARNKRKRGASAACTQDISELSKHKIYPKDLDSLTTSENYLLRASLDSLFDASNSGNSINQVGYQKLVAPIPNIARSRQSRQDAYNSTKQSLEIWSDTVKSIRNSDQLVFPLQDPTKKSLYDSNSTFASNTKINQRTNSLSSNLERTVSNVLSLTAPDLELRDHNRPNDSPHTSDINARQNIGLLRMERELFLRKEAKAKKIKRIKSKMYRRVLKRGKLKTFKESTILVSNLENNEALDGARSTEIIEHRRHKNHILNGQEATGDHEFQLDELRRIKEPSPILDTTIVSKLRTAPPSLISDDIMTKIELQTLGDQPHYDLHNMKFMQKPKVSDVMGNEGTENPIGASGRRVFHDGLYSATSPPSSNTKFKVESTDATKDSMPSPVGEINNYCSSTSQAESQNPWLCSNNPSGYGQKQLVRVDMRSSRGNLPEEVLSGEVDLDNLSTPGGSKSTGKPDFLETTAEPSLLAVDIPRKQPELLVRAFAGDKVLQEMRAETCARKTHGKASLRGNLPGWGTWCVTNSHAQRSTRVASNSTRNARLRCARLVVNQKLSKKSEKYLATNIPYPFESREQYERSLRFPIGQEWATKQAHQDLVTPKVIIKGGRAIAPLSKTV